MRESNTFKNKLSAAKAISSLTLPKPKLMFMLHSTLALIIL